MKVFAAITLLACVVLIVDAEPPVNNYLPPQQSYLPPSSTYGAPSNNNNNNYRQPSSQYGAPAASNNYNVPSATYGAPSSQYGAPSMTSAIFKQPSSTYGVPSHNNGGGYNHGGGYGNGGYENNEPARYNFEYNVQDYQSGNDFGHMEQRDGDRTTGKYYVLLPDGRKQIVNYEADQNGYRPTITYEQTNNGNAGGYNHNAQPNNNHFNGYKK